MLGAVVPRPPDELGDEWVGDLIHYGQTHLWGEDDGPGPDHTAVLEGMGIPVQVVM